MLLSIVKCGDHNLKSQFGQSVQTRSIGVEVEIIGPVHDSCVTKMRNRGSQLAEGRWLFFVDADCQIPISSVLAAIEEVEQFDQPLAAVSGIYIDQSTSILQKTYGAIQRKWMARGLREPITSKTFLANHLFGGALLVCKEAFNAIDGFDDDIGWGGEELDLVQRLQRRGYKTAVCYDLQVKHNNPLSLFGLIKRAWYQNFNKGRHSLARQSRSSALVYVATPLAHLLPSLIFFSVSLVAQYFGLMIRNLKG